MRRRLRVAWFSPLSIGGEPSNSLSAWVTAGLVPLLRDEFEIELFHDSFAEAGDLPIRHYLTAFQRHREEPYDILFYQLEDSPHTNFSRIHLGLMPGVVLFHDFMLSTECPAPIRNSPWQETVRRYADPHHPFPGRQVAHEPRGPLAYRELGLAALPLFSSPRAHAEYQRLVHQRVFPEGTSHYLPLPVPEGLFGSSPRPLPPEPVAGFAGTPNIEHRAHKVCQALARSERPWRLRWLIEAHEEGAAREIITQFGVVERVELIPGRSPAKWAELLPDLDVGLHLLFSVFGQPGPWLELSLAAGLPCLVTNFGSPEYLDAGVALPIRPGEHEAAEIRLALDAIARDGAPRTTGREFARENHDRRIVAGELAALFHRTQPALRRFAARWGELEREAAAALRREALRAPGSSEVFDPAACQSRIVEPVFEELGWR